MLQIHHPQLQTELLVTELIAKEALSQPFKYVAKGCLKQASFSLQDYLHQPLCISLTQHQVVRFFHGIIAKITIMPDKKSALMGFVIQLRPQFWFFKQLYNCRIFSNKHAIEIINTCFKNAGIRCLQKKRLVHALTAKEYTIQFNETDFNFFSRLLQENKLHYFFSHQLHQHQMHVLDKYVNYPLINGNFSNEPYAKHWYALTHWRVTESVLAVNKKIITGIGYHHQFSPGYGFYLAEHEDKTQMGEYYLTAVKHHAIDNTILQSLLDNHNVEPIQSYQHEFIAMPKGISYRHHKHYYKPSIHGYHPANVIGVRENTVNTDALATIQVRYPWQEQLMPIKKVPVLQNLADKNHGHCFLPRVGQQVAICFEQGDIEQPICMGSIVDNKHLAGMPHGITTQTIGTKQPEGHQFSFNHQQQKPDFNLRSSKDVKLMVKNDIQHKNTGSYQEKIQQTKCLRTELMMDYRAKEKIVVTVPGSEIVITPKKILLKSKHITMGEVAVSTTITAVEKQSNQFKQASKKLLHNKNWLKFEKITGKRVKPLYQVNYQWTKKINNKSGVNQSQTDTRGWGFLGKMDQSKLDSISCKNHEIIQINDDVVQYPRSFLDVSASNLKPLTEQRKIRGMHSEPGDKYLAIKVLQPPIILNLRTDAPPVPKDYHGCKNNFFRTTLDESEIDYFRNNGNNALLFIHGFNVPFGSFSKQIQDVDFYRPVTSRTKGYAKLPSIIPAITWADSDRTLYRDFTLLRTAFPKAQQLTEAEIAHCNRLSADYLNGSDAHAWFVHMENNLNLATGTFNQQDYTRFNRCLHIAWQGDSYANKIVNVLNYLNNEEPADQAGKHLVAVIQQLASAGIKIAIIAHSLGNRVLLKAMDSLAMLGANNILEHVFLWQAAVPDTALSADAGLDRTLKRNAAFTQAHQAAKKITVLYSKQDAVLSYAFWMANQLGFAPNDLFSAQGWQHILQAHPHLSPSDKKLLSAYNAYLPELGSQELKHLFHSSNHKTHGPSFMQNYLKYSVAVEQMLARYRIHPALGCAGPYLDETVLQLQSSGKLRCVDQSAWLHHHSAMMQPSTQMMQQVYKRYIIGGEYGLSQFGSFTT